MLHILTAPRKFLSKHLSQLVILHSFCDGFFVFILFFYCLSPTRTPGFTPSLRAGTRLVAAQCCVLSLAHSWYSINVSNKEKVRLADFNCVISIPFLELTDTCGLYTRLGEWQGEVRGREEKNYSRSWTQPDPFRLHFDGIMDVKWKVNSVVLKSARECFVFVNSDI